MTFYATHAVAVGAIAAVGALAAPEAAAAAKFDPQLSANVALTSNYVFRGITQTGDGAAIQGGFDAATSLFYTGVWASSVDFNDGTTLEVDFYGGVTPKVGKTTLDFGVIYYAYPDAPPAATGRQDFVEVYAGASRAFGPVNAETKISYSPDYYAESGDSIDYRANLSAALSDVFSVSGGVGAMEFSNDDINDDYRYYDVGATVSMKGFALDLRYVNTGGRAAGRADDAFVVSLSRSF